MANGKMDASMLLTGLEAINNVTKIADRVSKPVEKKTYREGDSTNQPHSQTVEVKVGSEQANKPVVVHEKKETHIHKPFPEGRELSERECEVEKMRLQLEADDKKEERELIRWREEEYRRERKEREERDRKERERRREDENRFNRRFAIGACVVGAVAVGCLAYSFYSDFRNPSGGRLAVPAQKAIEAEGTVK